MKLSEHFDLEEMTRSDYAIRNGLDNTPSPEVIGNLTSLCRKSLEEVRVLVAKPITILSGYRSEIVNQGIGGADSSQHTKGQAADIVVSGMSTEELFDICKTFAIFDQLINEFGGQWVHISYSEEHNRKQVLWAVKENGKTKHLTTVPAKNLT